MLFIDGVRVVQDMLSVPINIALHAHCLHTCSSKSECNELRIANSKLKDELEQLKEKYHSQLGDGVRIKREVYNM